MGRVDNDNTRHSENYQPSAARSPTYSPRWVSREQIERAKEVAVLDYVLAHEPGNVTREGNEYRLKDHDSLTMSNGKWNWRSRGVGGKTATALNFLIVVRGYGFVDAVKELAGDDAINRSTPQYAIPPPILHRNRGADNNENISFAPERAAFQLPPRNQDNRRVIAYLQSRGIDKTLISDCINRGDLYESAKYHNCVFVGRDESGKARFAAMRGTSGSFKRDTEGSDKRFGFMLPPDNPFSNAVIVCEAPIDCLSHQSLCGQGFFEPFDGWRLSLGGTALAALRYFLERHAEVTTCLVCTDNDVAGNSAAEKIAELPGIKTVRAIPPIGKDWNEALLALQKEERTQGYSLSKESR